METAESCFARPTGSQEIISMGLIDKERISVLVVAA